MESKVLLNSAIRLYKYLVKNHWVSSALTGPDVGIRFNSRIGRFLKGYLRLVPWQDNYAYMQTQGYWILSNSSLYELSKTNQYKEFAIECSKFIIAQQHPEGYWEYPNPEWRGRIATVEGNFACIGLLETFSLTGNPGYLKAAKKWLDFLYKNVGFQAYKGGLAVNYFASGNGLVPNNTTLTLLLLSKFVSVTGNKGYLEGTEKMVKFLEACQLPSGELPYSFSANGKRRKNHYLCYQYNAFELMDLVPYFELTKDHKLLEILKKLSVFLKKGVSSRGFAKFDCVRNHPLVPYYTAALAGVYHDCSRLGWSEFERKRDVLIEKLLGLQKLDGGFDFSYGNYKLLNDRRSYPRALAMILHQLLKICLIT